MISLFIKHKLEVRSTVQTDLAPVAENMRPADRDEIWASHMLFPLPALEMGLKFSPVCRTVFLKNEPIAIFGLVPNPKLEGTASVWMLGTTTLNKVKGAFGRMSLEIIQDLLNEYPVLYNYVDVRNKKSIAWLKFCGAIFSTPAPYGVGKFPFMYFQLRKVA